MKIVDLQSGQGKADITAVVKAKAEPRTFNKFGKDLRVCNATISDDSGEITLSLWNNDIDTVKVGDTVQITNGYVSEFNGQKQLTSGKFGKLEVVAPEGKKSSKASKKSEEMEEVAF